MTDGILPCKKCGRMKPRLIIYHNYETDEKLFRISCSNCGYCTKTKDSADAAYEAWNQRDNPKRKNHTLDDRWGICPLQPWCPHRTASCLMQLPDEGCPVYRYFMNLSK